MALPDIPNAHAFAVLLLTVLALVLFTREKIPLESSSLFVVVALIIGFELFPFSGPFGTLSPVDFFHGFGHEALIAVCALARWNRLRAGWGGSGKRRRSWRCC